jgi:tetratricopeptide (TPR) repeat protein
LNKNSSNSNTSIYKGNSNLGLGSNSDIPAINPISNLNLINETGSIIAQRNHELNQFAFSLAMRAQPYLDAAWEYYSKDDFYNAEDYAKTAINIGGNMIHLANYLLGLINRDRQNYYQAITYFDRAIDKYKKNGEYYAQRGLCYYYVGEKKKAKLDLKKGMRKGSGNAKLYLNNSELK